MKALDLEIAREIATSEVRSSALSIFSQQYYHYHYRHYLSQQNGHDIDHYCPSFILVVVHSEGIGNNIFQALRTQAPCHPIGEDMMIMN